MTRLPRRWIPNALLTRYRRLKRARDERRNERQSTEDVFTAIYRKNQWGGEAGALFSGTGTANEQAASAYVGMITEQAKTLGFLGLNFVDLGCGDFRIGARLLPLCARYTGVDIVKPVVEFNRAHYGSATTRFEQLNIVDDALPDGDVCFIRQVFQHLSNRQIAAVLRRLSYRWVFVTEHYPPDNDAVRPNVDKVQGGDIRAYDNSGVYLTEPPFALPADRVSLVLEVAADGSEAGVIRTFLYMPMAKERVG